MPSLRLPCDCVHADRRLQVLLHLPRLWRNPDAKTGRLLRVLLLWIGTVPAYPGGVEGLLLFSRLTKNRHAPENRGCFSARLQTDLHLEQLPDAAEEQKHTYHHPELLGLDALEIPGQLPEQDDGRHRSWHRTASIRNGLL